MLLLNAQDWPSLVGSTSPLPSHLPIMHLVKPLAAAAQALQGKAAEKKAWHELFDVGKSLEQVLERKKKDVDV